MPRAARNWADDFGLLLAESPGDAMEVAEIWADRARALGLPHPPCLYGVSVGEVDDLRRSVVDLTGTMLGAFFLAVVF